MSARFLWQEEDASQVSGIVYILYSADSFSFHITPLSLPAVVAKNVFNVFILNPLNLKTAFFILSDIKNVTFLFETIF